MHKHKAFVNLKFNEEDFQVTNELCDCVLSLPMHPYLKETDVELVAKVVSDYIKKKQLIDETNSGICNERI
jgi:dTDP-4-amino-4,6-dideoxygalactose transaminase